MSALIMPGKPAHHTRTSLECKTGQASQLGSDRRRVLQMGHGEGQVYGYVRLPCRVEVNATLGESLLENKLG